MTSPSTKSSSTAVTVKACAEPQLLGENVSELEDSVPSVESVLLALIVTLEVGRESNTKVKIASVRLASAVTRQVVGSTVAVGESSK